MSKAKWQKRVACCTHRCLNKVDALLHLTMVLAIFLLCSSLVDRNLCLSPGRPAMNAMHHLGGKSAVVCLKKK